MPGSWNPPDFPNLTVGNHAITSPRDRLYNCIAYAAGDDQKFWWPASGVYWPQGAKDEPTLEAFVGAFALLGYKLCPSGALEDGLEKIALYAERETDGSPTPTHAARQLRDGTWTLKIGKLEDISHDAPEAVAGGLYVEVGYFPSRSRAK